MPAELEFAIRYMHPRDTAYDEGEEAREMQLSDHVVKSNQLLCCAIHTRLMTQP